MKRLLWLVPLLLAGGFVLFVRPFDGEDPRPPPPQAPREEAELTSPTLAGHGAERPRTVATPAADVSLPGRVLDAKGRPLAEVRVRWLDAHLEEIATELTSADGAFSLPPDVRAALLILEAADGRRCQAHVSELAPGAGRIRLEDAEPLDGIVLTERGRHPVPGARVEVWARRFGSVDTVSAPDGTFHFDAVPAHEVFHVHATADGRGRASVFDLRWAPGVDLEILMPEARTLHGRVVTEGEDGGRVGVPDVLVRLSRTVRKNWGSVFMTAGPGVTTSADGSFVLEGVTFDGQLDAVSDIWCGQTMVSGSGPCELVVVRKVRVAGRVVDAETYPVPDAEVLIEGTPGDREVRTDADGKFVVLGVVADSPTNEVEVRSGVLQVRTEVKLEPGRDVDDLVLRLAPAPYLSGRVLDAAGRPVPCAVWASWEETTPDGDFRIQSEFVEPGRDGRFLLGGLVAGPCEVEVEVSGHGNREVGEVEVAPQGTDLGDIVLPRYVDRVGRVLDETGRPIPTASTHVSPGSGDPVPVGADGGFRVSLPTEGDATLSATAPGFSARSLFGDDLPAAGEIEIVLRPAYAIRGRVLDAEGRGVRSARVALKSSGTFGPGRSVVSDLAGGFRIECDEPGSQVLMVEAPPRVFPPKVEVPVGAEEEVVIREVPPQAISGRLVGPDRVGIADARVSAVLVGGGPYREARTGSDGSFEIRQLAGERFRIVGSFLPEGLAVRPRRDVSPDTSGLLLVAERARTIAGTVRWPDGRPAAGAGVRAQPVDHEAQEDFTEARADGTFALSTLLPGLYDVTAFTWVDSGPDEGSWEARAKSVVAASTNTSKLRLVLARED